MSAPRRPRRVLKPSASMSSTASKVLARQIAIRPGAADSAEQLVLVPLPRGRLGDDLLGQHVERLLGNRQAVELAAAHASSSAAHSTSSSRDSGNSRPFGVPPTAWPERPTRCRKVAIEPRRAELADEIDIADVDAELERRGRDQRLELAALEPLLGIKPLLLGEAAVVGGDVLLAEPLGQWRVTRSASRRVLTKISVVRCASTSSARRS